MSYAVEPEWSTYHDALEFILKEAKEKGATAAEAGFSIDSGLSVTVRLGEVETIEFSRDKGLGITVYKGNQKGSVSTTELDQQSLKNTVEVACRIAGYTEADPYAGIAEKEHLATDIQDLNLYFPEDIQPEQAVEFALQCETAARDFDKRIVNSDGATYSFNRRYKAYANSHGFLAGYPSSRYSASCVVIGKEDGLDALQRDYDYSIAREQGALERLEAIGKNAAKRTLKKLGARKIKTTQCPVLFRSDVAGSMLGHFISAISGGSLYRKSSFLLDHLGKKVFPEFVQIEENPYLLKGLGSAPFDGEGVKTQHRQIIKDGHLEGYVLSSYSARKLGLQTTGNSGGVHNLSIQPSSADLDFQSMIKKMDTGLVVTELMGHGINITTGDYSRGAGGFWVENGEIQYPVEEISIAGNLKNLFLNLAAVGGDIEKRSNILTGSLLFENMMVAGN